MTEGEVPGCPTQWTVSAVAARLGVAASTLRTWHRRHGVGPSGHQAGRYRRYSAADVARLENMCALVADGVPIASAAGMVRAQPDPGTGTGTAVRDAPPAPVTDPAVSRGLLSATLRLDGAAVQRIVEERIAEAGTVETWESLCVPALVELGRRTESGDFIDAEHLLSWTITAALHRVTGPIRPTRGRGALLACMPGERHTLALDALRACLAERGVAVRMLDADLPTTTLQSAARRTRPRVVALWAQCAPSALTPALTDLQPLASTVMALGPGWSRPALPGGTRTADTLTGAVRAITEITGTGPASR